MQTFFFDCSLASSLPLEDCVAAIRVRFVRCKAATLFRFTEENGFNYHFSVFAISLYSTCRNCQQQSDRGANATWLIEDRR
jgi:hypothetical protein